MITITLNGARRDVEDGLTLETLLARLELPAGRVAVERNRRIVPRSRYATEPVEPDDRLEIVTLVGGG